MIMLAAYVNGERIGDLSYLTRTSGLPATFSAASQRSMNGMPEFIAGLWGVVATVALKNSISTLHNDVAKCFGDLLQSFPGTLVAL